MPTLEEVMAALQEYAGGRPVKVKARLKNVGPLYVRPVTVDEAEQQSKDVAAKDDLDAQRALGRGLAKIICYADGTRVFDWRNVEQCAFLGGLEWPKMQKFLAASQTFEEEDDDAGN